jgi:hypothetical protein
MYSIMELRIGSYRRELLVRGTDGIAAATDRPGGSGWTPSVGPASSR